MLERLVPACVATAETRRELIEIELYPAEVQTLGRAVDKRRREFVTGRACARRALAQLGVPPVAIPSGERGEPLWPDGIVGSLTHCAGFRGCAVARGADIIALGIDAEPNAPLPAGVLEQVAFGPERQLVGPAPGAEAVHVDRLLFCVKEAVYKAWFPLARRWLGFEDAEVALDHGTRAFAARLLVPGPTIAGQPLTWLTGRWTLHDGLIAAAVVLRADESS